MALSKIRIFPITSYGVDGYPVYGTPVALVTIETGETEVNNIRLKITPTTKTKTLNADDVEEAHSSVVGYSGEIEAYGIDAAALAAVLDAEKDTNGNINHIAGATSEKYVGVFCQGQNEKGKKFQTWLYAVKFDPFEEELATNSETAKSIKLTFTGKVISTGSNKRTHATVFAGNTGYVAEGTEPIPTSIYKQPTSGGGGA